jgi:hypothetical protein
MWRRGELGTLLVRQWTPRLVALSMAGSVATSLTLIFGLRRIDASAGVILPRASRFTRYSSRQSFSASGRRAASY